MMKNLSQEKSFTTFTPSAADNQILQDPDPNYRFIIRLLALLMMHLHRISTSLLVVITGKA